VGVIGCCYLVVFVFEAVAVALSQEETVQLRDRDELCVEIVRKWTVSEPLGGVGSCT